MPDFSTLLAKPVGEIKKPRALPAGTYYGLITSFAFDESAKKKTPYVRYSVRLTSPGEDIDQSLLVDVDGNAVDVTKKLLNADFYLTEDAQYRCVEFLEKLGIDFGGGVRGLGECIPEAVNHSVMITVVQNPDEKDPERIYNNITEITAAA